MRIAIIGFGFSGLMAVANLVRKGNTPLTLYIVAENLDGLGTAYATSNTEHLLNVPAAKMGAFVDESEGFFAWLQTADAALVKQKLGLNYQYAETDFAPRALYGAYLQSIWRDTQVLASEKKCEIKLVPSNAVAIQAGEMPAVMTERGDAIAADHIILATGHETKPILTHIKSDQIIQNPWTQDALKDAASWLSPVMLMGTGLTAVDMVLSLRRAGYVGEIMMVSRNGWLPQSHELMRSIFTFDAVAITAQKSLRQLVRIVRAAAKNHSDWRAVVDAVRPYTQQLWQHLTTRDQQRFLARFAAAWNIHRHRMAPEIAARLQSEIAAGTVKIRRSKNMDVRSEEEKLIVQFGDKEITASRILNCIGPELNPARSSNSLLRQLLADQMVEPHATGLGIAVDPHLRAWGNVHPKLFVIGALITGQLLESTAVPELRAQAAQVAANITAESPAAI